MSTSAAVPSARRATPSRESGRTGADRRPRRSRGHRGRRGADGARELVVAVADEHETRRRRNPAAEQPHDVQGALVRPVCVLDDDHRCTAPPARLGERRRYGVGHAPRVDEVLDREYPRARPSPGTDRAAAVSRAGRTRPRGRSSRPGARRRTDVIEGCLTDAGLAADEDEAPVTGRGVCKRLTQVRERLFALDEDVGRR